MDNAISDHMDTIRWPDLLSTNACLSSGIARLSGPIWDRADRVTQVCHLERIVPKARSPNWPYGRLDRAPLSVPLETTLGAPRRGAKTTCERWQDRSVASDDRDPLADNSPYYRTEPPPARSRWVRQSAPSPTEPLPELDTTPSGVRLRCYSGTSSPIPLPRRFRRTGSDRLKARVFRSQN